MMTESFIVELATPGELVIAATAEMIVLPGVEGDFAVLIDHAPLITMLRPGVLHIHETESLIRSFFVAGGFVEVLAARTVILAEEAIEVSAINKGEVQVRLEKARHQLERSKNDKEKIAAEKAIVIAEAMLAATH